MTVSAPLLYDQQAARAGVAAGEPFLNKSGLGTSNLVQISPAEHRYSSQECFWWVLMAKSHQPASPGDIKVLFHCRQTYLLKIPINVLLDELGPAELPMAQDPPWLTVGGTPLWHSQHNCFRQRPKEIVTKLPFYKSPFQAHLLLPY